MQDLDKFTPEQLRALADDMERAGGVDADEHERRLRAIRGGEDAQAEPGYIRHVTIQGIDLDIDMRRAKDLRTLRLVARVDAGGDGSLESILELADFILGDQVPKVEAAITDADGFMPADRYAQIFRDLFEAVGAKN